MLERNRRKSTSSSLKRVSHSTTGARSRERSRVTWIMILFSQTSYTIKLWRPAPALNWVFVARVPDQSGHPATRQRHHSAGNWTQGSKYRDPCKASGYEFSPVSQLDNPFRPLLWLQLGYKIIILPWLMGIQTAIGEICCTDQSNPTTKTEKPGWQMQCGSSETTCSRHASEEKERSEKRLEGKRNRVPAGTDVRSMECVKSANRSPYNNSTIHSALYARQRWWQKGGKTHDKK